MNPIGVVCVAAGILALVASIGSFGKENSTGRTRYRAVLDVTGAGEEQWHGALNNIENLRASLGADVTQIEVVVHGKALKMLLPDAASKLRVAGQARDPAKEAGLPPLANRLKSLADAGVIFAACENTMQRQKVEKKDLVPFARTVDSAVAELVRRQAEGWAYIKPG